MFVGACSTTRAGRRIRLSHAVPATARSVIAPTIGCSSTSGRDGGAGAVTAVALSGCTRAKARGAEVTASRCLLQNRSTFGLSAANAIARRRPNVRSTLLAAGYMAKRVSDSPGWLAAKQVVDIYSVSGCISRDFANFYNAGG